MKLVIAFVALLCGCQAESACQKMCAPRGVKQYIDLWGQCVCADAMPDGGR